ncbi:hypothetical protein GGR27_003583 [Lewinella antarctica]|uniref:Uncharacterized protein n=1 Tax=Neolewinella antarctica TaxID=442734 RepID=A0ABX0XGT4_9BACT|nr:hypothetical protein [Neolewinella antarctica]
MKIDLRDARSREGKADHINQRIFAYTTERRR